MSEAINKFKQAGFEHQVAYLSIGASREIWRKALSKVTDEEWAEEIGNIKHVQLRACVASVVFWDVNKDENAFPKLKKLMDDYSKHTKIGRRELRKALVELGYPQCITKERATEQ